jgi:hypothetical protein
MTMARRNQTRRARALLGTAYSLLARESDEGERGPVIGLGVAGFLSTLPLYC